MKYNNHVRFLVLCLFVVVKVSDIGLSFGSSFFALTGRREKGYTVYASPHLLGDVYCLFLREVCRLAGFSLFVHIASKAPSLCHGSRLP